MSEKSSGAAWGSRYVSKDCLKNSRQGFIPAARRQLSGWLPDDLLLADFWDFFISASSLAWKYSWWAARRTVCQLRLWPSGSGCHQTQDMHEQTREILKRIHRSLRKMACKKRAAEIRDDVYLAGPRAVILVNTWSAACRCCSNWQHLPWCHVAVN